MAVARIHPVHSIIVYRLSFVNDLYVSWVDDEGRLFAGDEAGRPLRHGLVKKLGSVAWVVLLSAGGERVRHAACEKWRTRASPQTTVCLAAALNSPASSQSPPYQGPTRNRRDCH